MPSEPVLRTPNFRDDLDFCSNFYSSPFPAGGLEFRTVEHFYQSMLAADGQETIINAATPAIAKKLAKTFPRIPDEAEAKDRVMSMGLYFKFLYHLNLREKLLAVPNERLIETNWWHDNYWGACMCPKCAQQPKLNKLGHLLALTKSYFAYLSFVEGLGK